MVCIPYGGRILGRRTMTKARTKRENAGERQCSADDGLHRERLWLLLKHRQVEGCLRPPRKIQLEVGV